MTDRKIHNYSSDILIQETLDYYSYHPDRYKSKSAKWIIATCRYCGKPAHVRKQFYTQANYSACHKECRIKEQSELGSPFSNEQTREKAKSTNYERYGTYVACKNREIAERISKAKKRRKNEVNQLYELFRSYDIKVIKNYNVSYTESVHLFFPDYDFAINFNKAKECSEYSLPIKKAQERHIRKTRHCRKRNIRLFHIFDKDWELKHKQILNFIKTILNINSDKVMARKCVFNHDKCRYFINENHIQGYGQGTIKFFNLIYNDNIIASLTVSKHHRQNTDKKALVLNRLCFKDGMTVTGGASKMFKEMKQWALDQGYTSILSWSDDTWTEGNIYKVLGFKLDQQFPPDYFYWDRNQDCFKSKQSQKKSATNCPEHLTEREWCLQRELYRIWDSGRTRWRYDLT